MVIVQYYGDEKIGALFPHRNNKKNNMPYERTTPSKMEKFKQLIQNKDPHLAYKEAVNSNLYPRNMKQFQNLKQISNNEKKISKDELDSVHLLYFELKLVHQINTVPDIRIISYENDLIEEINNLLKYSKKEKIFFVYDTTFNMCNYFVSPLCARFSMLEDDPTVPLAFFIHESKNELSHTWFFQHIKTVDK